MNKFLILALFACVATALAGPTPSPYDAEIEDEAIEPALSEIEDEPSQLALFETDDKETAALTADKQIFADFCIQVRDNVKKELGNGVNKGADRIFRLMFETISEITGAVGNAEQAAVEKGSEAISEDARQIKSAVFEVVDAIAKTGKEKLAEILTNLKEKVNKEQLQEIADDSCSFVSNTLKPKLDKDLAAYKKTLLASSQSEQFAAVIKTAKLENLGCVTTSRVSKVATACRMVNLLAPTLLEFLGAN